jgi:hypothetical protein
MVGSRIPKARMPMRARLAFDQRIGAHVKRLRPSREPLESRRNVLPAPNFELVNFDAERLGRGQNLAHLIRNPGSADIAQHR